MLQELGAHFIASSERRKKILKSESRVPKGVDPVDRIHFFHQNDLFICDYSRPRLN